MHEFVYPIASGPLMHTVKHTVMTSAFCLFEVYTKYDLSSGPAITAVYFEEERFSSFFIDTDPIKGLFCYKFYCFYNFVNISSRNVVPD